MCCYILTLCCPCADPMLAPALARGAAEKGKRTASSVRHLLYTTPVLNIKQPYTNRKWCILTESGALCCPCAVKVTPTIRLRIKGDILKYDSKIFLESALLNSYEVQFHFPKGETKLVGSHLRATAVRIWQFSKLDVPRTGSGKHSIRRNLTSHSAVQQHFLKGQ